jgi:beta-lactamase regulating signal transducer with metallopeptidase domain
MSETVSLVLSLSISGSILAILIFAIKPLIRHRFSKSIQYYIWIIVLLRLILPFSLEESIMNNFFTKELKTTVTTSSPIQGNINPAPVGPDAQENVSNGIYNNDPDHSRYFTDLLTQYVVYIWLLGVFTTLAVNLSRYARFLKHLKQANQPASAIEDTILAGLLKGQKNVRLARNPLAASPMLVGIFKALIIIPDISFTEKQLKNILLHEVVHLKRFDVVIKWLTLIAVSLHWFNPMVYFVKREINHACELSCDEAVIKNLNNEEKQDYGDTLIAVVSEKKYPPGVLQATMSEEKETLKERLVAIMKYNKKPKIIIFMSAVLLLAITGGAVMLGGCTGKTKADVLYENNNFGFALLIPQDFMNEVEIKESDSIIYFVNKEIQATLPDQIFGVVGRIEIYDKQIFTRENLEQNEDIYNLRYLGENEKYYFGWAYATDLQVPPNTSHQLTDRYRAQEAEFEEIIKTFNIINISGLDLSSQHKLISFIKDYNQQTRMLTFDEIEWITLEDKKRIQELGLNADLFPNGYYIYNDSEEENRLKMADDAKIYVVNWNDLENPVLTDVNGFTRRMDEYEAPYHLTIKDDVIIEILEQYRP